MGSIPHNDAVCCARPAPTAEGTRRPGLKDINDPVDIQDVVIAPQRVRLVLCDEKQQLRILYSQAVEINSSAVDDLVNARGKVYEQEYDRLLAARDKARRVLNSARSALEQHKQEHGC